MENNSISVSFDFDGTLSRNDVQAYAEECMDKGCDVWVVTSRFDDSKSREGNADLFAVTDSLGIPRDKVVFTNMEWKYEMLKSLGIDVHLDDYFVELNMLKTEKVIGISVNSSSYRNKINRLIDESRIRQKAAVKRN